MKKFGDSMILRSTEKRELQKRINEIAEDLYYWSMERNLATNPERIGILTDRVRKKWSVTRFELSEIVNEVLKRLCKSEGE